MPQKPTILESKTLAQTRLFRIESMHLEFSNGERRQYERLCRSSSGGAVLIVPLVDKNTVIFIREYAAGVHRYELGFPKGKTETGENLLEAANREIKEEIGYGANKMEHLTSLTIAPGYLEHSTDIILARDLYEEKLPGDEPEELEVVPWRLDQIDNLLASGECTEARSIAALFLTMEFLKHAEC